MQSKLYFSLALASSVALTSCNKLGELSADNFTVTPSPIEAVGGKVPVTINGRFPEKYMKKKAIVTVTPVLRYAEGSAQVSLPHSRVRKFRPTTLRFLTRLAATTQ